MAKRFIDTDLFKKPFMRSLEAPYKALWVYLLCECDHAGVWTVELDVAQLRMGMKLDPEKALVKMGGAAIAIDGGSKWFLPDFVAFQYGVLNPANKVHASVLAILERNGIDIDNLPENKPLSSPLEGAKDKDKDKDKDKAMEKEKVKEKEKEKSKVENAEMMPWPTFDDFWTAYERKGNRKATEQEWAKIDQKEREAIMDHVPYYNSSKPDKQFRKDGERYLRGRVWEDEIVIPTNIAAQKNKQSNGGQSTEERRAERERIIADRYGN